VAGEPEDINWFLALILLLGQLRLRLVAVEPVEMMRLGLTEHTRRWAILLYLPVVAVGVMRETTLTVSRGVGLLAVAVETTPQTTPLDYSHLAMMVALVSEVRAVAVAVVLGLLVRQRQGQTRAEQVETARLPIRLGSALSLPL